MGDKFTLQSLSFAAFSVFIVWHVVAITIVGPFSKSYLSHRLRAVYEPYLALTELDRSWPFYAPEPFNGSVLRYETQARNGVKTLHPLTEAHQPHDLAYFRYTNFYSYLFREPAYTKERGYDKSVARYLCQRQASNNIDSVRFILLSQRRFTYTDYLAGKRSLDKEYWDSKEFGPYACGGNLP